MANRKKIMKGVSCSVRNGVEYWYAQIEGQKKYCGAGDKGREIAIAAKAKDIAKNYENKYNKNRVFSFEEYHRAIVDDAGKKVGLGNFWPSCKGSFGRWVVVHWVEREAEYTSV